jgi:site-specific recombinase XerC
MRRWTTLPRRDYAQLPDHKLLPVDVCGRKRSPATHHAHRKGVSPNNKGVTYEPTPYTDAEILTLLDACPETPAWRRLRAWIAFTYRSGLRISETLDLIAADLNPRERSVLVRHGKGDKRRISAMDDWGWQQLAPWLEERRCFPNPDGPVFCITEGPTRGSRWSSSGVRQMLAKLKVETGFEKRLAPHQLRHSMEDHRRRATALLLDVLDRLA